MIVKPAKLRKLYQFPEAFPVSNVNGILEGHESSTVPIYINIDGTLSLIGTGKVVCPNEDLFLEWEFNWIAEDFEELDKTMIYWLEV